jgi:hypothetical protein
VLTENFTVNLVSFSDRPRTLSRRHLFDQYVITSYKSWRRRLYIVYTIHRCPFVSQPVAWGIRVLYSQTRNIILLLLLVEICQPNFHPFICRQVVLLHPFCWTDADPLSVCERWREKHFHACVTLQYCYIACIYIYFFYETEWVTPTDFCLWGEAYSSSRSDDGIELAHKDLDGK